MQKATISGTGGRIPVSPIVLENLPLLTTCSQEIIQRPSCQGTHCTNPQNKGLVVKNSQILCAMCASLGHGQILVVG